MNEGPFSLLLTRATSSTDSLFLREGKSEPVAEKVSKAPAESVQKKQSELLKAIQHKKVTIPRCPSNFLLKI
jgi:hypothetical protein